MASVVVMPSTSGTTSCPATATTRAQPAAVGMTLLSISCVQLSDALSVSVIASVGPAGSAWLRMGMGALLLVAVVRPRVRSLSHHQWRSVVLLGVLSAGLSVSFMSALAVLPLGTAVAIEFLGPLGVAVWRSGGRGAWWPLTALLGVLLMTAPWQGGTSARGVGFALVAAACWAGTIVLTARVGAQVEGMGGVALAMVVAAVCLTPWGAGQAGPRLDGAMLALGLGLAVLMPVLPFLLELSALRRLPESTFATLMAFEPALGIVVGALVLGQRPSLLSAAGILLVVVAGIGVTRRPAEIDRSVADEVVQHARAHREPVLVVVGEHRGEPGVGARVGDPSHVDPRLVRELADGRQPARELVRRPVVPVPRQHDRSSRAEVGEVEEAERHVR
jgi:inner membrane transporter RhtA